MKKIKFIEIYYVIMTILVLILLFANYALTGLEGQFIGVYTIKTSYEDFLTYSNNNMVQSLDFTVGNKEFTYELKPNVLQYVKEMDRIKTSAYLSTTNFYAVRESLGIEEEETDGEKITNALRHKMMEDGSFDFTSVFRPEILDMIKLTGNSPVIFISTNPRYEDFAKDMLEKGIDVNMQDKEQPIPWGSLIVSIIPLVFLLFIYRTVFRNLMMHEKYELSEENLLVETPTKGLDDIGGHWEVKKELRDIIDLINNRDMDPEKTKYIYKGYLLVGPPGCGKTLLAKAIAYETNCSFVYASASSLVALYVGMGSQNVKKIFDVAKKNKPCIIFLDEIDGLGKRGTHEGHSEHDSTLNTLLTEIDGFEDSDGIIVIGATNFPEKVDAALTRAGRLERKIQINLPEQGERLEILKLYLKDVAIDDTVNIDSIAEQTPGFSGADLEQLVKMAVLETIINKTEKVTMKDIDEAYYKIVMQGNKRIKVDPELKAKRKITAYHESGHTIAHYLFEKNIPNKVNIIPSTSGAGGVTITTPSEVMLRSKRYLKNEVKVLYGGRIAEEYLLRDDEDITVGAQQDIIEATKILNSMVNYYGMNGKLINYTTISKQDTVMNVDEMEKLAEELYQEAKKEIFANGRLLEALADELLLKDSLSKDDIEAVILKTTGKLNVSPSIRNQQSSDDHQPTAQQQSTPPTLDQQQPTPPTINLSKNGQAITHNRTNRRRRTATRRRTRKIQHSRRHNE